MADVLISVGGDGGPREVTPVVMVDAAGNVLDSAAAALVSQDELFVTGSITTQNLSPTSAATAGSAVEITLTGKAALAIQVTGTYTGALSLQATVDGSTWVTLSAAEIMVDDTSGSTSATSATFASAAVGIKRANVAGYTKARISGLSAMTGTAVVSMRAAGAQSGAQINSSVKVIGQTAHDAGLSGNPVRVGVAAYTANPTAVQTGDQVNLIATLVGALINKPFSIPELDVSTGATPITITTSNQALLAAGVAGIKNYVTGLLISTGATWTANTLQVQTATTVILEFDVPAGAGIWNLQFSSPIKTAAAAACNVKATAAVTGTCKVNALGYQAP